MSFEDLIAETLERQDRQALVAQNEALRQQAVLAEHARQAKSARAEVASLVGGVRNALVVASVGYDIGFLDHRFRAQYDQLTRAHNRTSAQVSWAQHPAELFAKQHAIGAWDTGENFTVCEANAMPGVNRLFLGSDGVFYCTGYVGHASGEGPSKVPSGFVSQPYLYRAYLPGEANPDLCVVTDPGLGELAQCQDLRQGLANLTVRAMRASTPLQG